MEVSGKRKNIPWVSYVSDRKSGPEPSTEKERKAYISRRQSVTPSSIMHWYPLAMSMEYGLKYASEEIDLNAFNWLKVN